MHFHDPFSFVIKISEEEGRLKKDEEEQKEMWKRKREHEEQWEGTREKRVCSTFFSKFNFIWRTLKTYEFKRLIFLNICLFNFPTPKGYNI